tara:strand:+ start:2222 stop:3517 length:1296 start_codon:yes stop_codon:yes gene_type:complete
MNRETHNQLINSQQSNNVEILCVGTELLLGNILNGNAKWLAEQLASLGLTHYRQTVIGDNFSRLKDVILEASKRTNILITTGGLGPTPDDLTTEAIAAAFEKPLLERTEIWANIQKKLNTEVCHSAPSNRKQAFLPNDAQVIPNPSGTAPGMIWTPIPGFTILTFPGVPSEMKTMWIESAIPWFKLYGGLNSAFTSKTLHFASIPESVLAEKVQDLLENKNPTVAPYASLGEVKLRITAKSKTEQEAKQLIIPIEREILRRTGLHCFATEEKSLAAVLIDLLRERKETLAVAESCTGGGIGASLTAIPGSSDIFIGGVIAYRNSAKNALLDVPKKLLQKHGAVSKQVVEAMAKGVLKATEADWSIAVSGVAGPTGASKSKPIGLVQFCIAGPKGTRITTETFSPHRKRSEIQKLSVLKGLDKLRLFLLDKS